MPWQPRGRVVVVDVARTGDDRSGAPISVQRPATWFEAYLTTVVSVPGPPPLRHVLPATVTSHVPLINAGAKTIEGNGGRAPPAGPRRPVLRSRVDNSWVGRARGRSACVNRRCADSKYSGPPLVRRSVYVATYGSTSETLRIDRSGIRKIIIKIFLLTYLPPRLFKTSTGSNSKKFNNDRYLHHGLYNINRPTPHILSKNAPLS